MNRLTLKNKLNRYRFFGKSRKKQLMNAILDNNIRLVNALINDGVNINYQDNKGNTPLILASLHNKTDIVNILLSRPEININLQNNEGNTALFIAIVYKNNYIANILCSRSDIDVNLQNNNKDTVLTISIFNKNDELTKKILERDDIDVNLQTKDGNTALILASEKNIEIVRLLLGKDGIDVNIQNTKYGNTALIVTKGPDTNMIVEALLGMPGINVNIQNNKGDTVLIDKVMGNNTKVVTLLLERDDIDVNIQNNIKSTALTIAISRNNSELAKLLLERDDIDVNLKDNDGFSALINATHKNNTYIVKALLEKAGIDVNIQTNEGFTPLINATHHSNIVIVKLLLSMPGIEVNLQTKEGTTALSNAIANNNTEIIKLLITKNVKIKKEYIDLYIDHGGKNNDIIKYLEKMEIKWKGFTKSRVQLIDSIFSVDAVNGSLCPICLKYVYRTDGCMYMSHDCRLEEYYHKELYKKYSYISGGQQIVHWCTVCSRICNNHRHFPLLNASDPKPNPDTLNNFDSYGDNCIGKGGGGLPEKLSRFIEYKSILLSLQDQVGKITRKEGYKTLIEAVWNAPLNGIPETLDKPPGWDTASEIFPDNLPENTEEAPDIDPPSYLVAPTYIENGINNTFQEEGPAINFFHKQKNGSVKTHTQSLRDFVDFITAINPERPEFGKCMYTPSCNSCLHPEEVRVISEDLEKLDHAVYEKYKKDYNKFFNNKDSPCHNFTGGVKEMPRSNTRRNRRFRKTRSKKRA